VPKESAKPHANEAAAAREKYIRDKYVHRAFRRRRRLPAVVRSAPAERSNEVHSGAVDFKGYVVCRVLAAKGLLNVGGTRVVCVLRLGAQSVRSQTLPLEASRRRNRSPTRGVSPARGGREFETAGGKLFRTAFASAKPTPDSGANALVVHRWDAAQELMLCLERRLRIGGFDPFGVMQESGEAAETRRGEARGTSVPSWNLQCLWDLGWDGSDSHGWSFGWDGSDSLTAGT